MSGRKRFPFTLLLVNIQFSHFHMLRLFVCLLTHQRMAIEPDISRIMNENLLSLIHALRSRKNNRKTWKTIRRILSKRDSEEWMNGQHVLSHKSIEDDSLKRTVNRNEIVKMNLQSFPFSLHRISHQNDVTWCDPWWEDCKGNEINSDLCCNRRGLSFM